MSASDVMGVGALILAFVGGMLWGWAEADRHWAKKFAALDTELRGVEELARTLANSILDAPVGPDNCGSGLANGDVSGIGRDPNLSELGAEHNVESLADLVMRGEIRFPPPIVPNPERQGGISIGMRKKDGG